MSDGYDILPSRGAPFGLRKSDRQRAEIARLTAALEEAKRALYRIAVTDMEAGRWAQAEASYTLNAIADEGGSDD